MPTYQAQCVACDNQFEYLSTMDKCLDVPECPLCGGQSRKVILSAPVGFVTGKFEAFRSMVDGSLIRNNRELAEHNKRNNVYNLNDAYSEEKVVSGDFGQKGPVKVDKKELANDIVDSVRRLEHGYKPTLEVQEDD